MYIYMDNFRGFSHTYVKLESVNFLVGENSTGKSSLLGLINIFSKKKFWESLSFEAEETRFGHFEDIVSVFSAEKNYFSVGFAHEIMTRGRDKNNIRRAILHLFKYVEREGAPVLSEYLYFDGVYELHILIETESHERVIFYSYRKISGHLNEDDIKSQILEDWKTREFDKESSIRIESSNSRFLPFMFDDSIHSILWGVHYDIEKRSDGRDEIIFARGFPYSDSVWLAPIRTKPRRTYDEYVYKFSPEGEHTPYLIKQILKKEKDRKSFEAFVKRVGKDSGLFDLISVKDYVKSSTTSPFELDVKLNNKILSISNVGYGVSQALPIIVEMFAREKGAYFIVQQPEVHLHPKAQAALGTTIFDLALHQDKKFAIETHSDFLIDRYRISMRDGRENKKPSSQVLFFERTNKGNSLCNLKIDEIGGLPKDQPIGYRDFFVKEELKILGIE